MEFGFDEELGVCPNYVERQWTTTCRARDPGSLGSRGISAGQKVDSYRVCGVLYGVC